MLEDQIAPKRCGHTAGKAIVSREEALGKIRAAVDVRSELGLDILIMVSGSWPVDLQLPIDYAHMQARTDANATDGMTEAIDRCHMFQEAGADITFLEAPTSREQMELYCKEVTGPKMANLVEGRHMKIK
jgi:2-methylisocitrate lyase-like PEP mutase family enzyme